MLRIAIYGSECTGKTTLANHLATDYATCCVPEYSRSYAEQKPLLDITDVIPIMQGQILAEEKAVAAAKEKKCPLIICDTIPLSSIVYSQYYNQAIPLEAESLAVRHYDLYLFTDIDVPWQADGIRGENIDRYAMHSLFKEALEQRALPYTLLMGSFNHRVAIAKQRINQLIKY